MVQPDVAWPYNLPVIDRLGIVPFERWSALTGVDTSHFWADWSRSWFRLQRVQLAPSRWDSPAPRDKDLLVTVQRALVGLGAQPWPIVCWRPTRVGYAVGGSGLVLEWMPGLTARVVRGDRWDCRVLTVWLDGGVRYARGREQLEAAGRLVGIICYYAGLKPVESVRWRPTYRRFRERLEWELQQVLAYAERAMDELRGRNTVRHWQFVRRADPVEVDHGTAGAEALLSRGR